MADLRRMITERVDAGEQLPEIVEELKQEGFSKKDIDKALKEYHLGLRK